MGDAKRPRYRPLGRQAACLGRKPEGEQLDDDRLVLEGGGEQYGVVLSRPTGELAAVRTSLDAAAKLAEAGRFTVPIAAVFALNDYAAAHALSETGHARGKIVVTVP